MSDERNRRSGFWTLALFIAAPVALGGLAGFLTRDGMKLFALMRKPPLSPPQWLFPVAWTLLYIMMGTASGLVAASGASRVRKTRALGFYAVQLGMNFFWSIIFFSLELYLTAFVWLVGMWALVLICAALFWHIDRRAGVLMLPYAIWCLFAMYLNMGVYLLN